MTKTLFLPIEVKRREYEAQIFLALAAVKRGYRVYLGSHAGIYSLLKCYKSASGVYLDKSIPPYDKAIWLKTVCNHIAVIDAEISPVHSETVLKYELPNRLSDDDLDTIDKFFVVGESAANACALIAPNNKDKIIITGWPRFDLVQKLGKDLFYTDIYKIKNKYSKFLLVVSSFGGNKNPNLVEFQKKAGLRMVTPFWSKHQQLERYQRFLAFIETLKKWDADSDFPNIIVRPHVSESKRIWKKSLGKLKKTFVVDSGSVLPWIFSSQGVIHGGSTAAIEAYFAGTENYYFELLNSTKNNSIPKQISKYIFSKKLNPKSEKYQVIKNSSYAPSAIELNVDFTVEGSIEKILDEIDQLSNVEDFHNISRYQLIKSQISLSNLKRVMGLIRDEIFWTLNLINLHPQLRSIPWGLDGKSIYRMISILNLNKVVKVQKMTVNLWKIE